MNVPESILDLAPRSLTNNRPLRYDGTGHSALLSQFAPEDRDLLVRIYKVVNCLHTQWSSTQPSPDYPALEARIRETVRDGIQQAAHRLGRATREAGLESADVRKITHDIRGGGLMMVVGTAELLDDYHDTPGLIRRCAEAARDHAKIMRNVLPDIDPVVREADEATKAHGIDHFTDKWDGMTVQGPGGPVAVSVRCSFRGYIAARCLETSSIDRIVYNYVNNAVRFAADGTVALWVIPLGAGLTRWVVQNGLTADQAAFLGSAAGPDLGRLFAGGITRGGNGIGLANCAEIVADCFGLDSAEEAVERKYLGAAAKGSDYCAWFHWPVYEKGREKNDND